MDPGGEADKLMAMVTQQQVSLTQILLTHAHIDHVGAAFEIAQRYQIPIYGPHKEDKFWLNQLPRQSQMFGLAHCDSFEPVAWLEEGDEVSVGEAKLSVLHCPGHTPGHIVFINHKARLALVGDVIFNRGVGRTDFPLSDHQKLIDSIYNKLLPLGDDMVFIPGHGAISTLGDEKQDNPFL